MILTNRHDILQVNITRDCRFFFPHQHRCALEGKKRIHKQFSIILKQLTATHGEGSLISTEKKKEIKDKSLIIKGAYNVHLPDPFLLLACNCSFILV